MNNQVPGKEYTYAEYRSMIDDLLAQGLTTGSDQSEARVKYARLNVSRMNRLDKTKQIIPALKKAMEKLTREYQWLVITEGWCGDAAQSVPLMAAIAACSPKVDFRIILRDEFPEVMDRYLTGGSRSIPILVIRDSKTGADLAKWGPRPKELIQLVNEWKQTLDHDAFVEKIHTWYARNKTQSMQHEILQIVDSLI